MTKMSKLITSVIWEYTNKNLFFEIETEDLIVYKQSFNVIGIIYWKLYIQKYKIQILKQKITKQW